jgi:hypothetical protein
MGDFSFEDFNFGSGNEEYDFSGLADIGGGGQSFDFSGLDNLDISSLLSGGDNFTPGDYGGSLGAELAAALQDSGNASSLFSGDGGIDIAALLSDSGVDLSGLDMGPEAFETNSLTNNFDNFSLEEGQGTQNASDLLDSFSLEEGQGTQEMSDLFDSFSLEGDQGFKFDDDTEPGSSGGTQGSEGAAGEGDLGSYEGSSYGGGAGSRSVGGGGGDKKLVFDDDREPGSSGGSSGSTGVAGSGSTGSYKGSTYDDTGGTKTKVDDKGNVILPDGTKVTPGGTVTPPGTPTPKTPGTPTKPDGKKDNNMLMMMLALMAMMNKGGGSSTGSGGTIPALTANRSQLPYGAIAGSQARPGAGGVNYFSPTSYTQKAAGGGMMYGGGGISDLGGYSDGGRLLKGPGDGVSDSIPATIGGKQPARLATGEFVVPARVVSELGNGSTEAGAQKLYAMMDRVQKARRKTKNVAADTKAHKYLPS